MVGRKDGSEKLLLLSSQLWWWKKINKHKSRDFHTFSEQPERNWRVRNVLFLSSFDARSEQQRRERIIKYGKVGWKLSKYYKITKFNVVFNLKRGWKGVLRMGFNVLSCDHKKVGKESVKQGKVCPTFPSTSCSFHLLFVCLAFLSLTPAWIVGHK